jgi:tetratricopeptide (TPR) repeat protein
VTWYTTGKQEGMLIRGAIQDRLWGKTLGALGRRAVSGQLTIQSDRDTYILVFDHGHVVAASAPGSTASVIGLALQQDLITVTQAAELERHPGDQAQILEASQLLPADQVLRLRRQAIAAAATRTFGLEHGDFVFDSEITLPVVANTAMHVGGLIFHGVLGHIPDARLAAAVHELGSIFRVRADGVADLQYFGFGEAELVVVRALADNIALAQIEHLPAAERRIAHSVIYTLASVGALYCEVPSHPPRLARGTPSPTPVPGIPIQRFERASSEIELPRTSSSRIHERPSPRATEPQRKRTATPVAPVESPASLAYRRGQAALRDERLDDAIVELARAIELSPNDIDYKCALAWARFCKADNKPQAADAARLVLKQAVIRSEHPVMPYYYLGMLERILGRNSQALSHFQQVLELDPSHREAGTEVRFLSRTSGPIKR